MAKAKETGGFNYSELASLVAQARLIPLAKRSDQVRHAEALHDELEAGRAYPFDYVYYRLTGHRADRGSDVVMMACDLLAADLRQFIDRLSRVGGIAPGPEERVLMLDQVASRLGISTRTVRRWRQRGLRWRWSRLPGESGKRLTFTESALAAFSREHAQELNRARDFSRTDEAARRHIIERAIQLARWGGIPRQRIAAHLARKTGRAVETIRQILVRHDREHPGEAIFKTDRRPLAAHQHGVIERAWRRGLPIARIARHFAKTRMSIYRIIREQRARRLAAMTIRWVDSPLYRLADARQSLAITLDEAVGEPAEPGLEAALLPEPVAERVCRFTLNDDRAKRVSLYRHLLLRDAGKAIARLPRHNPPAGALDRIERDLALASRLADALLIGHLPLLARLTHRQLSITHQGQVARGMFIEALGLGLEVMREVLEPLDVGRIASVEDRLSWVVMRHFAAHLVPGRAARRDVESMTERLLEQLPDWPEGSGMANR
ncbi:MAG: hypothetical protein JJU36_07635 [Phycisphaeraceae bacterium]|nr:hypothetical protein [Phycisphaeraceae bacterium]